MTSSRLPAWALAAALLSLLSTSGGPVAASEPAADDTSATATASGKRFVTVLGYSVQDRPIKAFFRGNPNGPNQVVVLGQMHGDERAGARTARWLKRHVDVNRDSGVWIIPTMNPDGFAANTRQNAKGVDLNRNWPTNGWKDSGYGTCCWGGKRPASEPEVRAMRGFLKVIRPDYIASIHQPYGVIASNGKDVAYEKRLSQRLGLPRTEVSVRAVPKREEPQDKGETIAPTLTSWYNDVRPGTSVTIEYVRRPSTHFVRVKAGRGLLRSMRAFQR